ncbi:hypothetical protein MARLIPOL_18283, partial [Marinobacter lipolyticus SM19]
PPLRGSKPAREPGVTCMNYRCDSDLSKDIVLARASSFVEYDTWYSRPKEIDGRVEGSRIQLTRRGGFFHFPGRGRFDGFVQEIDGKACIVGKLSDPSLATGVGIVLGALGVATMFAQGFSLFGFVACGLLSLGGYALVKRDHIRIREALEDIAGNK